MGNVNVKSNANGKSVLIGVLLSVVLAAAVVTTIALVWGSDGFAVFNVARPTTTVLGPVSTAVPLPPRPTPSQPQLLFRTNVSSNTLAINAFSTELEQLAVITSSGGNALTTLEVYRWQNDVLSVQQSIDLSGFGLEAYNGSTMSFQFDRIRNQHVLFVAGRDPTTMSGVLLFGYWQVDTQQWETPFRQLTRHPLPATNDHFGQSVAIIYDLINQVSLYCIGALIGLLSQNGCVQIFAANGEQFAFRQSLEPDATLTVNPIRGCFGGMLVSDNSSLLMVGDASGKLDAADPTSGLVYTYGYNSATQSWSIVQILEEQRPLSLQINQTGNELLVGSRNEVVYYYTRTTQNTWELSQTINNPPTPGNGNFSFGWLVTSVPDFAYLLTYRLGPTVPRTGLFLFRRESGIFDPYFNTSNPSVDFGDDGDPQAISVRVVEFEPIDQLPVAQFPQSVGSVTINYLTQQVVVVTYNEFTGETELYTMPVDL